MGRKRQLFAIAPLARVACVVASGLLLAQCSGGISSKVDPKYGVSASPRVVEPGEPVPKGGGVYRVGKPYVIAGRSYVPKVDPDYSAEGLASWYGEDFHGRRTANGEVYDMHSVSAAHPTLPIPSYVRVTNLRNGRSIIARVNDRGPFHKNRLIDVSVRTAKLLDFHHLGLTKVRVDYVGPASLEGSDDRKLVASLRHRGRAPAPKVMLASAEPAAAPVTRVARSASKPVRVPPSRPFANGDDDVTPEPTQQTQIAAHETPAEAPSEPAREAPSELTAAARIENTLGPAPRMAWITGPSGVPASGVLRGSEPVLAYAPKQRGAEAAVMSGRGLY